MSMQVSVTAALGLVLAAAACGGSTRELDELAPQAGEELTVIVRNQNFYDATIYATAASVPPKRVGVVTGNSEETFTFAWTWIEVDFEIRLTGPGRITTGPLPVEPGDVLELTIPPDADRGVVQRRP